MRLVSFSLPWHKEAQTALNCHINTIGFFPIRINICVQSILLPSSPQLKTNLFSFSWGLSVEMPNLFAFPQVLTDLPHVPCIFYFDFMPLIYLVEVLQVNTCVHTRDSVLPTSLMTDLWTSTDSKPKANPNKVMWRIYWRLMASSISMMDSNSSWITLCLL